jgi:hypothetical protein
MVCLVFGFWILDWDCNPLGHTPHLPAAGPGRYSLMNQIGRPLAILLLLTLCGCATKPQFIGKRPFDFQRDTFAFTNELVSAHYFDSKGDWKSVPREPRPDYTHHCFALAKASRQFFQRAEFAPHLPKADDETYRTLIQRVVAVDPARDGPGDENVVIPGYPNLRAFSRAHEQLLKDECGGKVETYIHRSRWRMAFPFRRTHQARMANQFLAALKQNRPPVIHLVLVPKLTIDHVVIAYAAHPDKKEVRFDIYDPNHPEHPGTLIYNRATHTFYLPTTDYFPGGRVDAYEIYKDWKY